MSEHRTVEGVNVRERIVNESIAKIKDAPLYLASSSQKRKDALVGFGFKNEKIHLLPAPEEVETKAFEDYEADFSPNWGDVHRTMHVEEVAKAKLESLLSEKQIPDDAVAVAFDTLVAQYTFNPKKKDDPYFEKFFIRESIRKPESNEKIREVVGKTLYQYVRMYLNSQLITPKLTHLRTDDTLAWQYENNQVISALVIKTGGAIRFPHEKKIQVFSDEIRLTFMRLMVLANTIDTASVGISKDGDVQDGHLESDSFLSDILPRAVLTDGRRLSDQIDLIVDELIAAGVTTSKATGGLDYTQPQIEPILGIQAVYDNKTEADKKLIYSGFPIHALQTVLEQRALEVASKI